MIELIFLIIWLILIIPFTALFKVMVNRLYWPEAMDGRYILMGIFWFIVLPLCIVGQLLYALACMLGAFYEWFYKFLDKHIK